MNDIVAIMRAADFAARKHTKQKLKGEEAEPYLSNLLAIAERPPSWPPDRKRAYVEWARPVVSGLPLSQRGYSPVSRRQRDWRWKASSGKVDVGDAGGWTGLSD